MKRSSKKSLVSVFFTIFIILLTAGNTFSEEYNTLKGLKSVKAVFDFELGNPQSALVHLKVIDQTFKDKNITALTLQRYITCRFQFGQFPFSMREIRPMVLHLYP